MRLLTVLLTMGLALAPAVAPAAAELPIFDAHVHFSHDAADQIALSDAVAILRKAGLKGALVSSSDDAGTQKLYEAAPDIVVPELRPYRRRGEIGSWMRDATVIDYLEARLKRYRYAAIGEFHKNLWADLAFRTDQASGGKVDAEWRKAFEEFPDRFMVGTDTFTPERWYFIGEHADWSREWLKDLPPALAERIAWKNGEDVIRAAFARRR
jgi:hypothetical protein